MQGAFKLFRFAGVQVYLHYTWFILAYWRTTLVAKNYHSVVWAALECIALFGIVLLHEFGHALACRQVGGVADLIVLWPLGGVAFVRPPLRPGAQLWSIAAGPLVNVLLTPLFAGLWLVARSLDWRMSNPDLYQFVVILSYMNLGLLVFNLLPIYPLDGGQIVRSLLWFKMGPIRSLKIACVIGFVGAIAFGGVAFWAGSIWLGILAFFIFMQAQAGWRQAQQMALVAEQVERPAMSGPPPLP